MACIALWQAGQWRDLAGGVTGPRPSIPNEYPIVDVRALLPSGSDLYVGGSFTNAGGVAGMNVARWDGTNWHALGEGIPTLGVCDNGCTYPVTSLAILGGQLFAGGGFTTSSGLSYTKTEGLLACWNGLSWSNVAAGPWAVDSNGGFPTLHVWALASTSDSLYVGGNFSSVDGLPSYGLAIWHEGSPPVLHLSPAKGHIILSWPREFQLARIESTTSLTPPLWRTVSSVDWPVEEGATNDVRVEIVPSGQRFYRLRWR